MCNICGQPDYLRCNCEAAQPFCDQCEDDNRCSKKMDAQCVIYHFETDIPSTLTCLGIENGTSLEDILEVIDGLVCNSFNIPFEPVDTESIEWEPGGQAGHKPKAHVRVSPEFGNNLIEKETGMYASPKVSVDEDDEPDYLENQITGGIYPSAGFSSGFISNNVVNDNGLLRILPFFDAIKFFQFIQENHTTEFCELVSICNQFSLIRACGTIEIFENFVLGEIGTGFVQIPVVINGSGTLTIIAQTADGEVFGTITQQVTADTPYVVVPIQYTGEGSDGTHSLIISFYGMTNVVTDCAVDFVIGDSGDCIGVTIVEPVVLPDAFVDSPYSYAITLSGTSPFALDTIVKPAWMTIGVTGNIINFTGTPDSGDVTTGLTISFNVTNCSSGFIQQVEDEIDVLDECEEVSFTEPTLPDAIANQGYSVTIPLLGTPPFSLSGITKPTWMGIAIVGSTVELTGTPVEGDVAEGVTVAFTVENDCGDQALSQTIDVTNNCFTYFVSGNPSVSLEWEDCQGNILSATFGSFANICVRNGNVNVTGGSGTVENSGQPCT
jgi:hypothetical protein